MTFLADVETLKKSPLPEVRETIAKKICEYYNKAVFEEEEENIACEIIRLFARDIEIRVRVALSESLKSNPSIPHDVALRLANDEVDVALPILEFSMALTEGDVIEIIRSTENVAKLIALSKREDVTDPVSSALVYKRNEEVTVSLLSNESADISENSLLTAVEEFAKNGDVINSLINRGGLPIGVVEKMITQTTDKLRKTIEISLKEDEDKDSVSNLVEETQERATLGLLSDEPVKESNIEVQIDANTENISKKSEQLAKHLYNQKRLTSSIMLRAVCEGNQDFFESSLSVKSGTPLVNVRALVRSGDKKALASLFQRADFPLSVVDAVVIIVQFVVNEGYDENKFSKSMKQKLVEHIESNKYDIDIPLMPYLLALISSDLSLNSVTN